MAEVSEVLLEAQRTTAIVGNLDEEDDYGTLCVHAAFASLVLQCCKLTLTGWLSCVQWKLSPNRGFYYGSSKDTKWNHEEAWRAYVNKTDLIDTMMNHEKALAERGKTRDSRGGTSSTRQGTGAMRSTGSTLNDRAFSDSYFICNQVALAQSWSPLGRL